MRYDIPVTDKAPNNHIHVHVNIYKQVINVVMIDIYNKEWDCMIIIYMNRFLHL